MITTTIILNINTINMQAAGSCYNFSNWVGSLNWICYLLIGVSWIPQSSSQLSDWTREEHHPSLLWDVMWDVRSRGAPGKVACALSWALLSVKCEIDAPVVMAPLYQSQSWWHHSPATMPTHPTVTMAILPVCSTPLKGGVTSGTGSLSEEKNLVGSTWRYSIVKIKYCEDIVLWRYEIVEIWDYRIRG